MMALYNFTQEDLRKLFANRFVVVIGDSVMRTVYKDLVVMLQCGKKLTSSECRNKGEPTFHSDKLIEGGRMTNGKDYREVRQYVSPQHLIRFYFVTRIYSSYVETIFADFYTSLKPDIVIMNSCLWDISRYGVGSMDSYKLNLQKFFCNLKRLLPPRTVVVWTTTLPVSSKVRAGFLSQGTGFLNEILRLDVLVANNFSTQVATQFGFGVLDMHFLFRSKLHLLAKDGVHWNEDAHRDITNILTGYICHAMNIVIPKRCRRGQLLLYGCNSMGFGGQSGFGDDYGDLSFCQGLYNEVQTTSKDFRSNNLPEISSKTDSWAESNYRKYCTMDGKENWKNDCGEISYDTSNRADLNDVKFGTMDRKEKWQNECWHNSSFAGFRSNQEPHRYIKTNRNMNSQQKCSTRQDKEDGDSYNARIKHCATLAYEKVAQNQQPFSDRSNFRDNWTPYQGADFKGTFKPFQRGKEEAHHRPANQYHQKHCNESRASLYQDIETAAANTLRRFVPPLNDHRKKEMFHSSRKRPY